MRNLKRALSLTLASVMLLGMMVVGSSAAVGYPDVAEDDNVEAIEVVQSVGVMVGDENGNFNPDAPLTREEAASIICRIKGLAPNQSAISNYIDSGRIANWAKPYVGAATQAGYMTGSGDGRFNPQKALTRAEAAAVLAELEAAEAAAGRPMVGEALFASIVDDLATEGFFRREGALLIP